LPAGFAQLVCRDENGFEIALSEGFGVWEDIDNQNEDRLPLAAYERKGK